MKHTKTTPIPVLYRPSAGKEVVAVAAPYASEAGTVKLIKPGTLGAGGHFGDLTGMKKGSRFSPSFRKDTAKGRAKNNFGRVSF